ncbi:hypothetical protein QBC38DRAFT_543231 [Podospora fimiseda]|uniref:Uncharacterized protein n=1 Tax=Podospora fimiseda TaxID=252190 RepID=A0AAN7BUK7_9PEZI|nr:hypothetical protein QBC38DRAFT_543231 [Podospora fimiseda]
MGPPLSTPTPSRFLLSKRQHPGTGTEQQSQAQTPNQQNSTGAKRFHPTPRFSTSTPRPSFLSVQTTPALSIKPKTPRLRTTQDLIDDSSPLSEEEHDEFNILPEPNLPEPIEFDSSLIPQSSLPIKEDQDEDEDFDPRPQPKRRRISITSLLSSSPPIKQEIIPIKSPQLSDHHDDDDIEIDPPDNSNDNLDFIASFHSSPPPQPDPPPSSLISIKSERNPDSPILPLRSIKPKPDPTGLLPRKEPIFHPPPKFKQPEPGSDDSKPTILPDTPHRHSKKQKDKYLPFGLASEVRDWLVDAKELFNPPAEQDDKNEAMPSSVQLKLTKVQHAAGGPGMVVVSAQQPDGGEVNAILAGEGTAVQAGLDREKKGGGIPKRGVTVSIGMPAWDVDLGEELGTWAVAYRWEVLNNQTNNNDGEG